MIEKLMKEGEDLFAKGDWAGSRNRFLKIIQQDRQNKIAFNNMGVLAFKEGRVEEARQYFQRAAALDPNYRDACDNLAQTEHFQEEEQAPEIPYFVKGKKIGIVNSWENKFNEIYRIYFSRHNEVRLIVPRSGEELKGFFRWADIVWSAWCNEPLVLLSRNKPAPVLITHIRSYEILQDNLMQGVAWGNVDGAIFVGEHIRRIAAELWPVQMRGLRQTTIHNCVELDKYPAYEQKPGFNIAYVSFLNHKKGIGLLLQCLRAAVDVDPRYCLHIAGTHQEVRFKIYLEHLIKEMDLERNLVFHGWVKDIQGFMKDMNYSISTSPWEGCPNNVIEALACGVKPLIHNWRGAKEMFPPELVFNTVADFTRLLTESHYDSHYYRSFAARHFNAAHQVNKIDKFIAEIMRDKGII